MPEGAVETIDAILARPKEMKSIKPEWQIHEDSPGRFFVYQPTGGWGNQRMILASAIVVANAMNRTLVLPMIAPRERFL